ncbi:MAG: hypothetical protein HYT72_04290 [Candidatus Aenigmarchaeota archaeon]|nr:hypothetical protein [Candidatus Aenigmarchaeota archaeon]
MYRGKHYSRALLSKRTRELVDRYLAEEPRKPKDHLSEGERPLTESADRLVLSMYLNFLVNARTDKERSSWWHQAQEQAEKLGLSDYSMSVFTKRPTHEKAAA